MSDIAKPPPLCSLMSSLADGLANTDIMTWMMPFWLHSIFSYDYCRRAAFSCLCLIGIKGMFSCGLQMVNKILNRNMTFACLMEI